MPYINGSDHVRSQGQYRTRTSEMSVDALIETTNAGVKDGESCGWIVESQLRDSNDTDLILGPRSAPLPIAVGSCCSTDCARSCYGNVHSNVALDTTGGGRGKEPKRGEGAGVGFEWKLDCNRRLYGNGHSESNADEDGDRGAEREVGGKWGAVIGTLEKRRKLVLHFDIRNTILVADSVTQVKVEQALNTFLTGVTWGEDVGDEWVWLSDAPSLSPPHLGAITYYKYLEKRLVRCPDDRAQLRQATGDFTQQDLGRKFRPYFEKHLQLLRWNHKDADKLLTMEGCDGQRYHYLLPSFVRLLYDLQKDERDFSVVLRTYGMDATNVLACLEHIVSGNHPEFRRKLPITVHRKPGSMRRRNEDTGVECCFYVDQETEMERKTDYDRMADQEGRVTLKDDSDIYRMLSKTRGVWGFVDDFVHWQQHEYSHFDGKPFWIDPQDDTVQHIFFDDNIRVTASDSIVDVRVLCGGDRPRTVSVDLDRMADLDDSCLVQADLLQSITDTNYFVEKVKTCEKGYSELLAAASRSNGFWSRSVLFQPQLNEERV